MPDVALGASLKLQDTRQQWDKKGSDSERLTVTFSISSKSS
jgi:hypothetical protein